MTDHNQPRWQREFGDMPTGTFPATPDGWDDESWRNDVCPHFVAAEGEGWVLTVWVDYPDKADREFPSLKRFRAYFEDPTGAVERTTTVAETDRWETLLANVDSALAEQRARSASA